MVIYQPVYFGTDDFWQCEKVENFSYPAHMHRCLEWIYVLSGKMTTTYDTKKYVLNAGESMLFMSNVVHSFISEDESEFIYLCFSPELVPAFIKQTEYLYPQKPDYITDKIVLPLILSMKHNDKTPKMTVKGILYLLCSDFYQKTSWQKSQKKDASLLNKIILFIQENFSEDISLNTLSREFGYDYHYLSRYFKNNLNTTFSKYLTTYRINHACFLLKENDCTITQAAGLSGYSCIRSFNKAFKNITGMTPSEYKKLK